MKMCDKCNKQEALKVKVGLYMVNVTTYVFKAHLCTDCRNQLHDTLTQKFKMLET